MELSYAIEYLTTLAEGVDPATGEVLPEGHICNRGDTVRALYATLQAAQKPKEKKTPRNAGKPWPPEDDARLLSGHRAGYTVSKLAKIHERTYEAIRARLVHLGEIEKRDDAK